MEIWNAIWKWVYGKALEALVTPAGGAGVAMDLGSGYSLEGDIMQRAANLKALCDEAVANPSWVAHDITGDGVAETFCNRAAAFIAQGMGYFDFPAKISANQMIEHMASRSDSWTEEHDLDRVADLAQKGALIILGVTEVAHGHVTVAAPLPPEMSGSLGYKVPMVAHVGGGKTPNGIVKVSEAFKLAQIPRLRAFVLEATVA